jgi:YD repeat-containing protein
VATRERDGVGTGATDSLAYTYDADKNRTKEEDYDGSKTLTHRIVYTWRDTQPGFVLMSEKERNDGRLVLSDKQGRLTADLSSQNRGMITVYDMAGKRISRIAVDHSGMVPLTGIIGKGSYIAVFSTSGINKQTMNFTIYN